MQLSMAAPGRSPTFRKYQTVENIMSGERVRITNIEKIPIAKDMWLYSYGAAGKMHFEYFEQEFRAIPE